jgi:RNA recognition motif-containing protein
MSSQTIFCLGCVITIVNDVKRDRLIFLFNVLALTSQTGERRGFAFIYFQNHEDALEAIKALNGRGLQSLILKVDWARPETYGRGSTHLIDDSPRLSTEAAHVEAAVADALLEVLQDAPDGQILASQLCINLYKKCPDAKAILQEHGGAKSFIQIPRLKDAVCYIADQVPEHVLASTDDH